MIRSLCTGEVEQYAAIEYVGNGDQYAILAAVASDPSATVDATAADVPTSAAVVANVPTDTATSADISTVAIVVVN